MSGTVHLVVGPDEHGVVRHGVDIARGCDHRMLRAASPADVAELPAGAVVHLPFTDRLFGETAEAAADAVETLAARIARSGGALSVTLHDVPHDDSPLQRRRRAAYDRVMAVARGVVVNSRVELALVEDAASTVHSLRMIPLPVRRAPLPNLAVEPGCVGVLGFVYPDRGYDDVLAALPDGAMLTAIGRAADGHDDLLDRYAATGRWHCTGYVPDDELPALLATTAVPVAPNRRVTASASVNTWLGHSRRPLVPDSPYAREIAAQRPGAVTVYDPDRLAEALAAALADPASTWLPADVWRGPERDDVAADYRAHLDACTPERVVLGLVPGNRWDLVDQGLSATGTVGVVVPYYEAQHQLDLVLTMLAQQTRRPDEIVVVDDGSRYPPDVSRAGAVPTTVLRQDDRGFRAARARNIGAAATSADVLVFLDGDTVPEPGFVDAITRLPMRCPEAVTVGRRRHANLSGVDAAEVAALIEAGPVELTDPAWLRAAYAASSDLLHADRRSYRYVISAVLALPAALWRAVGGFDERFVGYGGEDWELAHRLRNGGAVFAHVPEAVAWHDGPDWAERADPATRTRAKNAETAALAALLPDPDSRGPGRWWPYPSVVVTAGRMSAVDALATVRSAAHADCAFWFEGVSGEHRDLVLADPAVHLGTPPVDVSARAWCHVRLNGPTGLGDLMHLADLADRHGRIVTPAVTARSARAGGRASRWAPADHVDALAERLFGRQDRSGPTAAVVADLAGWLRGGR